MRGLSPFLIYFASEISVMFIAYRLHVHQFVVIYRPKRTLYSKKYGVAQIQFTHAPNTVIHTSTKVDGKMHKVYSNVAILRKSLNQTITKCTYQCYALEGGGDMTFSPPKMSKSTPRGMNK